MKINSEKLANKNTVIGDTLHIWYKNKEIIYEVTNIIEHKFLDSSKESIELKIINKKK